jgi:23S rRNA (cytidine1920-2'-O)/16S rRNA (cytidine1409-2'-O)-methyltransferase
VVSVYVAYGQFAWSLRNDPRVTVLERTNIRTLDPARAGGQADVVVADLAFISLASVAGTLAELCAPAGDLVVLVKPQFELPRDAVERGGVVRNTQSWIDAMTRVAESFAALGFALAGATPSPLVGPKGNREFFLHLSRARAAAADDAIERAAEAAP